MNTPRTDAERRVLKKAKSYPVDPVSAKFAEKLETELQAMTALADRLATACLNLREGHPRARHTIREALAAYEAHKKGNTP